MNLAPDCIKSSAFVVYTAYDWLIGKISSSKVQQHCLIGLFIYRNPRMSHVRVYFKTIVPF